MKQKIQKTLAALLCLVMCAAVFTGCGKEEEKKPERTERVTRPAVVETEAPDIYSISAYFDNDELEISLDFYDDFTLCLSDSEEIVEGTYYFDRDDFVLTFDDVIYEGYITDDGMLSIYDVDGYFYAVEELGYYPDDDRFVGGNTESNREYVDQGDGTIRYRDYNGQIGVTYPEWMTNYEDELGTGTILISDNDEGYVLGLNLTDAYWNYDGTTEDFLMELYNNEISDAFDMLYGSDWENSSVTFLEDSRESYLGVAEANLYNDDYDIMVRANLYFTLKDGEILDDVIAKIFFYEFGNDGQYQELKDNVKRCVALV